MYTSHGKASMAKTDSTNTRGHHKQKRGMGGWPSLGKLRLRTRATKVVGEANNCFHHHCSSIEKRVMSNIQEEVYSKRRAIQDEDILSEAKEWVPDPVQKRTRETKYFHLTKVHWLTKAMVSQVVVHQQLENVATRHIVRVLEAIFELFCKAQFGICFHERAPGDQKEKPTHLENIGSMEGTRERPILVEEDKSESSSCHNKGPKKGAVHNFSHRQKSASGFPQHPLNH